MNECGIDVAQCVKRNRNRLNEQRTSARHGHSGRKSTCTSSGRFPSTTQGVMSEVGRGGNRKTKNARAKKFVSARATRVAEPSFFFRTSIYCIRERRPQ